jgi:hypothetical protein
MRRFALSIYFPGGACTLDSHASHPGPRPGALVQPASAEGGLDPPSKTRNDGTAVGPPWSLAYPTYRRVCVLTRMPGPGRARAPRRDAAPICAAIAPPGVKTADSGGRWRTARIPESRYSRWLRPANQTAFDLVRRRGKDSNPQTRLSPLPVFKIGAKVGVRAGAREPDFVSSASATVPHLPLTDRAGIAPPARHPYAKTADSSGRPRIETRDQRCRASCSTMRVTA